MAQPKETVELIKALLQIAAVMAENFKDGVQATDLMPIIAKLSQDPIKQMLVDAYNGIDKIPSEMKEASLADDIKMIADLWPELQALIKSVQK